MPVNRLVEKKEVDAYAACMFDAANEEGGQSAVIAVRNQMEDVLYVMRADIKLSAALTDSEYTPEQRNETAHAVFSNLDPAFVEVMGIMAERGDADKLSSVLSAYDDVLDERLNLCVVEVTTAVELDDNLRRLIIDKTQADLGKNVVLRERIDKSIIGGIIMSANGKRIDASVSSQLSNARSVLMETSDGGEC